MSGRRSIEKGKRGEREVCRLLKEGGVRAKRVPLSGSTEFAKGDVVMEIEGKDYVAEVKLWSRGFDRIYKFLEGRDMVFCRGDRKEWMVVMKLSTFLEIVNAIYEREIDLLDYVPERDF